MRYQFGRFPRGIRVFSLKLLTMKVYRKSPHFLSEWGLWISPVEENFKSNLVCKWFEFASPRPLYFVNHYKQLHFFFFAQFFKPCSTGKTFWWIFVDNLITLTWLVLRPVAFKMFTITHKQPHTHTKQWYFRLVYIKYFTKNLKIIWQYFKVTGNNSIGWNIFSLRTDYGWVSRFMVFPYCSL